MRGDFYAPSADGRQIIFATNLDVVGEQWGAFLPGMDLFTVPAGGGVAKKLMRSPARIIQIWPGTALLFE